MACDRRLRLTLCLGSVALLLGACGSPTTVTIGPFAGSGPPGGPVHTPAAAGALARELLTRIDLPPGSQSRPASPSGRLDRAPQEAATPDLAQATSFAVAAPPPGAVLAFLSAHPPTGAHRYLTGSVGTGGGANVHYIGDEFGGMPDGVEHAQLLVSVTAGAGGGSDIRVDAQVVWLPPKPDGALVPGTDVVAIVSVTESQSTAELPAGTPPPRRIVVTRPADVARLRQAADGLPSSLPGVTSCPADLGTRYVVAFATAPAAVPDITFSTGSCISVEVTRPGRPSLTLGVDAALPEAYGAVLGLPAG